jgi:hypothetical protein
VHPARPISWLPLASVLAVAMAGLLILASGVVGDQTGRVPLPDPHGSTVETLADPHATFAWPDITAPAAATWQPWRGAGYIYAPRGGAVWVRFTLRNPSAQPLRGVIANAEHHTDRFDFWSEVPGTPPATWPHARTGELVPVAARPIWGRDAAFFVSVPARGAQVVYLRIEDRFAVWFLPAWWPQERAFLGAQLRQTVAEALYIGVLLALFVYNGVLWARFRHRDLGYYLGYLGCIGLGVALARVQEAWLGFALGSPKMEVGIALALAGSGFFAIQFAREFLSLAHRAPRLDRVVRVLRAVLVGLGLGGFGFLWFETTVWQHLVLAAMLTSHGVLFVGGVVAWRGGVRHAKYFLLSFGCLLAGLFPVALSWLLAIPLGAAPLVVLFASALEMLLLSLALSERFARLQQAAQAARLAEEKTRLEMLRYQLNPHFLFNALNSVYGLVYPVSRPAGDLVRRLADFCRSTFTRDVRERRPLREEFAVLRNYLEIEQLRWRDRLVVEFRPDPAADDFELPAFLLLPLTENAIKHGGATSPDILRLGLTTQRAADGSVTIELANTGRWAHAGEARTVPSHGIGLENLRARLDRAFPGTHTFTTESRDGWVYVRLHFTAAAHPPAAATPA